MLVSDTNGSRSICRSYLATPSDGNLTTGKLATACVWKRKIPPMPLRCQAPFTTGFERSCSAPFFTGDESLLTGIRCAACIPLANACRTRALHRTRVHDSLSTTSWRYDMPICQCKCDLANLKTAIAGRRSCHLRNLPCNKTTTCAIHPIHENHASCPINRLNRTRMHGSLSTTNWNYEMPICKCTCNTTKLKTANANRQLQMSSSKSAMQQFDNSCDKHNRRKPCFLPYKCTRESHCAKLTRHAQGQHEQK